MILALIIVVMLILVKCYSIALRAGCDIMCKNMEVDAGCDSRTFKTFEGGFYHG